MTDLDRLNRWMDKNSLTVWQLARELGLSRHTVYSVVVTRKKITDSFVTCFIRRYGPELATTIFTTHLLPDAAVAQ